MNNYVAQRSEPDYATLIRIANTLDTSIDFRFQGDHPLALGRRPLRVSGVRDSDSQKTIFMCKTMRHDC